MLINQTAARQHWGERTPLGRRLVIEDQSYEVVGVVGDIAHRGSDAGPRPVLYLPVAQARRVYGSFIIRTDGVSADVLPAIREVVHSVWPHQPISDLATLEDGIWRASARRRFNMMLVGIFGVLAVAISVSGLGGVMACTVNERRREMAIRLALGAQAHEVIGRVLGRSAAIILSGLSVGLVVAWMVGRYVESYLFEVRAHDLRVLAATAVMLMLPALFACWPAARRASDTDPATILKSA